MKPRSGDTAQNRPELILQFYSLEYSHYLSARSHSGFPPNWLAPILAAELLRW